MEVRSDSAAAAGSSRRTHKVRRRCVPRSIGRSSVNCLVDAPGSYWPSGRALPNLAGGAAHTGGLCGVLANSNGTVPVAKASPAEKKGILCLALPSRCGCTSLQSASHVTLCNQHADEIASGMKLHIVIVNGPEYIADRCAGHRELWLWMRRMYSSLPWHPQAGVGS
jgi:hypothetical protein